MKVEIEFLQGARAGQRMVLDPAPACICLGRLADNHVVLDPTGDLQVSGRHAEVRLEEDGAYELRDLGSTNGTFLDGQQVTRARIVSGQTVRLGPEGPMIRLILPGVIPGTIPAGRGLTPPAAAEKDAPEAALQEPRGQQRPASLGGRLWLARFMGLVALAHPAAAGAALFVLGPDADPVLLLGLAGGAVGLCAVVMALDRAALGLPVWGMTAGTLLLWPLLYPAHLWRRRQRGVMNLGLFGLLGVLVLLAGMAVAAPGVVAYLYARSLHPALVPLGPLLRSSPWTASVRLDGRGGELDLGDGARLEVPAGALSEPVKLDVERVDLDLKPLCMRVPRGSVYIIKASAHVERLRPPVVFHMPLPARAAHVDTWRGDRWVPLKVSGGARAKVKITHFSGRVLRVLEEGSAWLAGKDPGKVKYSDRILQDSRTKNPALAPFYGIGETYAGSTGKLCREISDAVVDLGESWDYPSLFELRNWELYDFLIAGNSPRDLKKNYFSRLVAHTQDAIKKKVLASKKRSVTPARLMRFCLEANKGNVPLAVLACHNYLKNLTYDGRNKGLQLPADFGEEASRLLTWRSTERSPAGEFDKMGPLYHIFAAMTAGVWFNGMSAGAYLATLGEAGFRILGPWVEGFKDVPDPEKADADRCGTVVARNIRIPGMLLQNRLERTARSVQRWYRGRPTEQSGPAPRDAAPAALDAGAAADTRGDTRTADTGVDARPSRDASRDRVAADLQRSPDQALSPDAPSSADTRPPADATKRQRPARSPFVGRWRGTLTNKVRVLSGGNTSRRSGELTITPRGEGLMLQVTGMGRSRYKGPRDRLVRRQPSLLSRGFGGAHTLYLRADRTNPLVARGSAAPPRLTKKQRNRGKVNITIWLKGGRLHVQARSTRNLQGRTRAGGAKSTITVTTDTRGVLNRVK